MDTPIKRQKSTHRWVGAAIAIALLGAITLGTVSANAASLLPGRGGRGDCLKTLVQGDRLVSSLDELVADNTITVEQREAIIARISDEATKSERFCAGMALVRSSNAGEAVRDLLGMDRREIRQAWRDGQSLAEIAEGQGVDRATLVDTIIAAFDDRLSEAVANGRLTEERKAEILVVARERVESGIDLHAGDLRERAPGTRDTIGETGAAVDFNN